MNRSTPLTELLQAIEEGLNRPAFLWQVVVIVLAVAGAWFVAGSVRARVESRLNAAAADMSGQTLDVLRFSIDGVRRLAFPVTAMVLLFAGELALRAGGFRDVRVLRLALLLLGAMALISFIVYVLRRVFMRSRWLENSERTIAAAIWLAVALYATGLLGDVVQGLEAINLPIGKQRVSLWLIAQGLASVAITMLAALWLGSVLEARLLRAQTLDGNLRYVFARLLKALLLLVAVLTALPVVGIDLTVLSVFGGALGVGLGLGLQRIASNYVAGFIILLDRSLRIGDTITVDKYSGAVTQINTRYTVVRALDGTEAIVPNEMLVATPVTNHSFADPRVSLNLKIMVTHEAPLEAALKALEEGARAVPRVVADPAPAAYVTGFVPEGVELQAVFWIRDPDKGRQNVISDVALAVCANLQAAGIAMPLPDWERHRSAGTGPSISSPANPTGRV
jgi:small-conductance mechanosensitive channel